MRHADTAEALRAVTARIAPVWPLDRFVAVNPYLGLQALEFVDAVQRLQHVAGARSTMSHAEFQSRLQRGSLHRSDLDQAIEEAGSTLTADQICRMVEASAPPPLRPDVLTVADVLDEVTTGAWGRFTVEHLGGFFAAYFDAGYAGWQPQRDASLFATWKAEAEVDRTPEILGARGFRAAVTSMPANFEDAASLVLDRLAVSAEARELYLHRVLMRLGGWSAYASRLVWERLQREGATDDTLNELLAVGLAFELALFESLGTPEVHSRWRQACARTSRLATASSRGGPVEARVLLQQAAERGVQRTLISRFNDASRTTAGATADDARSPRVQAIFCIDVRSEVFRRHLEAADSGIETLGFAGFFGMPVEFVPIGHDVASAQCPVLLTPSHRVAERVMAPHEHEAAVGRRVTRRTIGGTWQSFKAGAISCFAFVSPLGLAYLPKLFTDGWGLTRPVPHPATSHLGRFGGRRTVDLEEGLTGGHRSGIALADRIDLAAKALTGMSLHRRFGRLVVLTGHGATSVNNPHASGLDCGACGGRSGEANVRVAVQILNDRRVREGLKLRGIHIPDETLFVAALHDTTTDLVTIFERERVPASHRDDLQQFEHTLEAAGRTCRLERARRLEARRPSADREWIRRSRDWAQVRPEWGLAGCAAFVAAPRHRTAALDLEGRAFLHSYSWHDDRDFAVLELIMTAPMIVASWINLQYYGSSVDPDVFGAGNKTLHNVVGGNVGVVEGNGGDLRIGLPWQSVHDGQRFQHEPIRLNVMIEAPIEAINSVIDRHDVVRQLLDNGWIHLFAIDDAGRISRRYAGNLAWCDLDTVCLQDEHYAWSRVS